MNKEEHEAFWIEPNTVVRQSGQIDRYCGLDFCDRSLYARGLCSRHYENWRQGKPLKPILTGAAFGATPCHFQGCDGVAVTRMPGSQMLCGAHMSQLHKGIWQPVSWRQNEGFNADKTRRVCSVCKVDKPVHEFYDRNAASGYVSKSKKCKLCFRQDVEYYAGRRATKSDGSDPKGWKDKPEVREAAYRAKLDADRERARRKAEKNANL
jgi:hypothetical protein